MSTRVPATCSHRRSARGSLCSRAKDTGLPFSLRWCQGGSCSRRKGVLTDPGSPSSTLGFCTGSLEPLGAGQSRRPAANNTYTKLSPFQVSRDRVGHGRKAPRPLGCLRRGPSRMTLGTGLRHGPLGVFVLYYYYYVQIPYRAISGTVFIGLLPEGKWNLFRKPFYDFWKFSGPQHIQVWGQSCGIEPSPTLAIGGRCVPVLSPPPPPM